FAAPVFAQDDYPKFQVAPGYGNMGLGDLPFGNATVTLTTFPSARHSGFVLDTDYNLNSRFGIELFTGYYNIASGTTLYTNTFGATAALRKSSRIIPFGTA